LFCFVIDEQGAFYELATVKSGENDFAAKIKMLALKVLVPNDALFRWSIESVHFPFASAQLIKPAIQHPIQILATSEVLQVARAPSCNCRISIVHCSATAP